ncbi:hypothetical protein AB0I28_23650 [Phytomonospora sp. NPDC050363]|uniref:hypothetical protein n=1 Tax=Phytomonospora sp. NPDC050363 TaxID=3155642 RepID=UPI0033D4BCB9
MATEDPYGFAAMLGEPSLPVAGVSWDEIEGALGVTLPDEYKAWADRYRSLRIGEYLQIDNVRDFVELLGLDGLSARLGDKALAHVLTLRSSARLYDVTGGDFRYRADEIGVYPAEGGLLRIGLGDDNQKVYLLPPASAAGDWRVVATDCREWWLYGGGFDRFLFELATGTLECGLLPDLSATPVTIEERESFYVYPSGSFFTNWLPIPP